MKTYREAVDALPTERHSQTPVQRALQNIRGFRHIDARPAPTWKPPIPDRAVEAWIAQDSFVREGLPRRIAAQLAYIDTFKPKPANAIAKQTPA